MKKFLATALVLCSAIAFAQDKFIEVEVEDTISLIPLRFEYVISVYIPDPEAVAVEENAPYDIKSEKEKYAEKEEELRKLLKKNKYQFSPVTGAGETTSFYNTTGAVVNLKNVQELQALEKLLGKVNHVSGSLGKVKYANEQMTEEELFRKLVEKAKAKATLIAKASGIKAGQVVGVREVEGMGDLDLNIHDTYFVTRDSKNLEMRDGKLVGSLYKKLVVRFAAE